VTDIFISYARDDNLPPPDRPDRKGFVTFLEDAIRFEFTALGPERPKIWRDTKRIAGGDQFTEEIEQALKKASLLVVVLSPNWMASRWCKRELETFVAHHPSDGIRERIIVVGKRHVDPDRRPSLLQGQTGFKFYVRSDDPEEIVGDLEFFDRGEPRDERYWQTLKALAAYFVRRQPRATEPPPSTGRTIFVAKPASDMRKGYDRVVSELVRKGHAVVPDPNEDIPLETAVDAIDAALSEAEIAVHLLGDKAGDAPEDQPPMVRLQLERAAARALKDPDFHRVVWAPALWTPSSRDASQAHQTSRLPLEVLDKFDRLLERDKVQGDTLNTFVVFLNQHLDAIARPLRGLPPGRGPGPNGDIRRLFLHHSREDSSYAFALARALRQHKLETWLPALEGSESEISSYTKKQLAECDGVILCWASASEVWVRAQASALRNWPSLGRSEQFCYRAIVAAPPPGERKKVSDILFPPSEIDLVVDLSDTDIPTADLLEMLVPAARAGSP
jgi:hypothetical protein